MRNKADAGDQNKENHRSEGQSKHCKIRIEFQHLLQRWLDGLWQVCMFKYEEANPVFYLRVNAKEKGGMRRR